MFDGVLSLDVLSGPLPMAVYGAAAAILIALLLQRPTPRRMLRLALAAIAGVVAAVIVWLVCVRWLNLFGESLGMGNYLWIAAASCGVALCAVSIGRRPRWRTVVAIAGIPVFAAAATLGINANYGLDRTVGGLLAIAVPKPVALTPPTSADRHYDTELWKHWTPPGDMPAHGEVGTVRIPPTRSGFAAREAGLYLPPAARVKHPPVLPLIVMMMGQPGSPDPTFIAEALDRFSATHHGLAPIVIVPDQLGDPTHDTLCRDTRRFGNVETYITQDVSAWAERNLTVTHDHRFWTVAGYSNGGLCALSFGIDRPDLFANVLDISGEEYSGAEHPDATLRDEFGGDAVAYDRSKPFNRLRSFAHPGTTAIFTACADDPAYHRVAVRAAQLARAAGINTAFVDIPKGGHGAGALNGGLDGGLPYLYPLLGLEAPR
ncbi:esterase [Leifsonia sp. LS1]|uniref:alpha/beta hydrolase n=1 Tax=Leifsonia sp. LS1 TaxID=2828483 RepID=UPI001CFE9A8B|nr:alpha/beta hydrolase-fold protein [Leifsonia sp. LS1]GIT78708.1 esterase [Leifsonia sp. LS1]